MTALTDSPAAKQPRPCDQGWFSWNIARGTALWSDSVHRLHGYEPGQIVPSSALTFHHKHPEDLYGCVDALHAGMLEKRLVVHEHRLVDAQRQPRAVVMVCRPVSDCEGRTRSLRGFLLPSDPAFERARGLGLSAGQAPLTQLLGSVFEVSEGAARALLAARRPLTARRSQQQQDFARRYTATAGDRDLRRTLEDSLFPLEHLTFESLDLAA
jgi:hypothetical protein